MKNNAFVKSAIIITIATFISKVLGSVFQIPLQNIAGDEVLGIFRLVYPVYMIVLTLSTAGIPIAISKLISEARALKQPEEIRHIFLTASILTAFLGCASFSLVVLFSDYIAMGLGTETTKLSIIIVSFTLLLAPYMAVYRGFFQGFEDISPTAVSQVIEQFIRVGLIVVIAYYLVRNNASNEVIAGGVMIGSSVGVLFSLLYLRKIFVQSKARPQVLKSFSWHIFRLWSKRILKLSIPIAIGTLTMALLNLVDSVTIPHGLQQGGATNIEFHYGIYGRGLSLVQIAVVFSSAIILPLIPLISKTMVNKETQLAKDYIARSLKMTHLLSWPAAIGLAALALPINLTLFTDLEGSAVLAIISFSSLFTSLTVLTTGILQGLNRASMATFIVIVSVLLKACLNLALVAKYGIIGAAWSTLIIYILLTFANLTVIYKEVKFSFHMKNILIFAAASIAMGVIILSPMYFMDIYIWNRLNGLLYLLVMIPIGAIFYAVAIIAGKGITKQEIKSYPIVGRLFGG